MLLVISSVVWCCFWVARSIGGEVVCLHQLSSEAESRTLFEGSKLAIGASIALAAQRRCRRRTMAALSSSIGMMVTDHFALCSKADPLW